VECNFEGSTANELDLHMSNMHGWSVDQKSDEILICSISSQVFRICDACDFGPEDRHDLNTHHFELCIRSAEFVINYVFCKFCNNSFEEEEKIVDET
jgi:hypothetical protein